MNELKKQIIEALKDQKEIFGDELLTSEPLLRKTSVIKSIQSGNESQSLFNDDLLVDTPAWKKSQTLEELDNLINTCTKCPLHKGRTNFVFGVGNPDADVMVIGEGPGADEDAQGEPFVGRAGKLLNDILKAINFKREEVYIANIVKCRPPGNRTPASEEMEACIPYLHKQIDLIKPKLILCLGLTAAQGLLKKRDSLTRLRGQTFEYRGAKVMVTYHPAALLRNPNWKRPCWEDVQNFRQMYDEMK
ncbi:MAG: uracil-DNA glycosylase [Ignavibacteriales bacterium]|nr:MAG: uracil-DNA glycosylase [Ignavibacteriales bacterium]